MACWLSMTDRYWCSRCGRAPGVWAVWWGGPGRALVHRAWQVLRPLACLPVQVGVVLPRAAARASPWLPPFVRTCATPLPTCRRRSRRGACSPCCACCGATGSASGSSALPPPPRLTGSRVRLGERPAAACCGFRLGSRRLPSPPGPCQATRIGLPPGPQPGCLHLPQASTACWTPAPPLSGLRRC